MTTPPHKRHNQKSQAHNKTKQKQTTQQTQTHRNNQQ